MAPDTVVRSILQDSRGHYWFGTWNSGVYRYDGHELTRYTEQDGLSSNQVRNILEDRRGRVWFETASGVSRFDGEDVTSYEERDYSSKHEWALGPDDLWFKGDSATGYNQLEGVPGVYRFDGNTFHYHAFPLELPLSAHNAYSVTGIDQDGEKRVWIATYGAVIGYDGSDFTVIDDEALGHTHETGFLHARCVLEDSKGRLWIGNNGIGVILREGESIVHFTQAHGVGRRDSRSGGRESNPQPGDAPPGASSMHRVFSIGEDREDHIWFGTIEQGAWRYDGAELRQFTEKDGLMTKKVVVIYTDSQGDLWLGGNGVYKFNGETFERQFHDGE